MDSKISKKKSNINSNKNIVEKISFSISKFPLGINNYSDWYIRHSEGQNQEKEFIKVNKFIKNFCLYNDF